MAKTSAARAPALRDDQTAAKNDSSRPVGEPFQSVSASGFPLRPLQVTWEITPTRTSKGAHARVSARARGKQELSTAEAFHLIDEVAALHVPLLAVTGGDPLARGDLLPILQYASRHSVR